MIRVVCGCGRVFKAEDRHAGKRTRCPVCGTGLIIGQTPVSSSSEGDLDEVPSWWYPSDPQGTLGLGEEPLGGLGDPESVRTAVLPPVPEPGLEVERKDAPGREALGDGAGRRPSGGFVVGGWRPWALAGAVAASALLALGVLFWMRAAAPDPGERIPARGAACPREGGRGTAVPEDGEVRDRGSASAVPGGRPGPAPRRLRLLVPAYIYPTGEGRKQWRRLIDAAAKVDLIVIVNPDSGPGIERNNTYTSAIAEAADRGVKLVGYVNTEYAARPVAKVKADIDAWVRFYPQIVGFFLDQQPGDAGHAAYFAEVGTYARGKLRDALVITNPGIPCDEAYLARRASDLVCVFGNFEGFGPFEIPAYLKHYDPSHFAALVHQVADAEVMTSMLKEAIIKRIGYIYITDGKPPNQWGRLPAYWEAEVEAVSRLH
jgi:hypothetical protein